VANAIVENALNATRLAKTLVAARKFSRARVTPNQTEGQSQFNMRSGMSLDPRVGKLVSKVSIRERNPLAWQVADVTSSSFIDPGEIDAAVTGVRTNGFYVFNRVADTSITDAIRAYAERVPCVARGTAAPPSVYPRSAPQVGRYDIDEVEALGCAEVQDFATDPALALIAQKYLGQPVIMDEVAFWWTTNKRAEDANLNAQMFHQDRDRLSFLKFFMYLTDVTTDTGPHIYMRGSQKRIPWALRSDGRMTDDAVREAGLWDDVTELTGPAGTIMAVDTIGLHKGKTPVTADRLALENEFSTSLFGMNYERPEFTPTEKTHRRFMAMPWVLQRYSNSVTK
jgi:hypothetical protein